VLPDNTIGTQAWRLKLSSNGIAMRSYTRTTLEHYVSQKKLIAKK
jgi:hypothetical protein